MSSEQIGIEAAKRYGEILKGAAHADGRSQEEEEVMITRLLQGLINEAPLPQEIMDHLSAFNPETLDLEGACAALELETRKQRRQLLLLVARVTEVDEVHDLDEGHYIKRIARYIGASPEEYADLAADVTSGEGDIPPPVPRG